MKRAILILSLLHHMAMAQDCGSDYIDSAAFYSQPWIGNNQLLIDFNDSIQNILLNEPQIESTENLMGGFDNQALFNVPLKIWVYYSASQPIPTNAQIQEGVRLLNNQFSGEQNSTGQAGGHTNIRFYALHSISYILNEQMAINATSGTYGPILENNYQPGAINMHIVIQNAINFARFPNTYSFQKPYVCFVTIGSFESSTLAHEVGHALGLQHTHAFPNDGANAFNKDAGVCRQEAVDRQRDRNFWTCGNTQRLCEVNGDGLCDTEADPILRIGNTYYVSGTGQYTGGGQDNWNDPWNPNTFNIMSYSLRDLREYFSPMQKAVMSRYIWYTHQSLPTDFPYLNFVNFVDIFEPNNQISTSNPIVTFGESQWHNFHNEAIGRRPDAIFVNNDVDFVRFDVPEPGKVVNIYTSAVPHRPQANTEIYLIDQDGSTILASNDNISASKRK